MEKPKRRWGDRKDGRLIRELDPMHFIVPLIYPNRCDNRVQGKRQGYYAGGAKEQKERATRQHNGL